MPSWDKISILDCTFRDGGYYTNWNFDPDTVEKYLAAMSHAGVDVIEIGFRFALQEHFVGGFGYSTDEFLRTLPLPQDAAISVMINAKDVLGSPDGPEKAIGEMFGRCDSSPVDMVRVAFHFPDLARGEPIVASLKELGYQVGVNMMQVDSRSSEELSEAAHQVRTWDAADVLYFADSFGNMNPQSIRDAVDAIAREWPAPIGLHSHDNKGQALQNSIAAMEAGVTWLDGTILGMGRGAGNVRTEYLLLELAEHGADGYYPDALYPLVMEDFEHLRKRYEWGPNLAYHLSATYGVHPSYVQEMLGAQRYGFEHVISALEFLRDTGATSFTPESLQRALAGREGGGRGSWDATGWAAGRTVLIIGPGPGAKEHLRAICRYIDEADPAVLCLNVNHSVPKECISAYVACHESRILMEAVQYRNLGKPLLLPFGALPEPIQGKLQDIEIWDYGMTVAENSYVVDSTGCVLPQALAIGYALAAATAGGAKRILLAGLDGYAAGDARQEGMLHLLKLYQGLGSACPLIAVTPTTYPVKQSSIYAPGL